MKKVLVLTPFFYPHIGGSQQYMEDIYAYLVRAHKDIKVDVLCYNTDNVSSEEAYRGLRIYRIPGWNVLPGRFALPSPITLFRFLYKNRSSYDIIHCSTRFFDTSWWGPLYARLIHKRVILTDHCADTPTHPNFLITKITRLIDLTLVKFFLNLFNQIYVTNKAAGKYIKDKYGKDSILIYGGVDTEKFKPSKKTSGKKPEVLFVGRMIESKGTRTLFEVAKRIPTANFVFAGPGFLVDELSEAKKRLRLKNIEILGPVKRDLIPSLMNKSDILANPSFHAEGFPNVLLEAGACRLFIISTSMGGSGEIVEDGVTGLLVKPNDIGVLTEAIKRAIYEPKLRQELSISLYNKIQKKFSWPHLSEQLYKELNK